MSTLTRVVVIAIALATASASADPSWKQLDAEGQQAFDRGDYPTAVSRWTAAYEMSKLPLFILDIAQAYRLANDCAHALAAYQRFIILDPRSEQRGLAESFVTELLPQCGARTLPEPVKQRVAPRSEHGYSMKIAGLAAGGAGVALVAAGLVFGRRAVSLGDEVTSDCKTSCDWSVEKTKQSDGQRDATAGKVLDVIGVAAIASGAIAYYLGDREGRIIVVPRSDATGATLTWRTSW